MRILNIYFLLFFTISPFSAKLQVIQNDSINKIDNVFISDTILPQNVKIDTAQIFDSISKNSHFYKDSIVNIETGKDSLNSLTADSLNNDSTYFVKINKQYLKSYYFDTRDIIISPTRWNNKQWLTFSGLALSFPFLLRYDDDIQKYVQKRRTSSMDRFSANYLEPWGSGYYSMSTMALFYLYGSAFKKNRIKKVAMLGVKTYIVTGFMVLFPKNLLGRHRPYQDNPANPYSWNGFLGGRSFVSGHTTSIWGVSTIVASEYKDKPLVPVICYTIASLSSFSRIYDNKHWLTDVLGGAFFGYAMGKLIYNANNWKLKVIPYSNGNNVGLDITYPLGLSKN